METKKCNKCFCEVPIENFHKDKYNKDGLRSYCKKCVKEYDKIQKKEYYQNNKNEILERNKFYSIDNNEKLIKYRKQYRVDNKQEINNNRKMKKKNDISFRLRCSISSRITTDLAKLCKKKGKPSWSFLPYTPQQLKEYIESLCVEGKSWMTWENYGMYDINRRTWQIDHIIPQNELQYDSLSHPNFLKCWALSNLQPLGALENILKGDRIV